MLSKETVSDTHAQGAQEAETVLEVTQLGVDFWVEGELFSAAKNMSYTVKRGEVLALVGESGSGKSTSTMALLGLLPQNARVTGSIKLLGQELNGESDVALRKVRGNSIATIFQEPMTALNPVYTIGFQISEALRSHNNLSPENAKVRAIELLGMVEMPNPEQSYHKYPHQLSGGQRQRAMIAQSISCDPVLLVADEPTTALDVTVQAEILDLLRQLHYRLNSAIILITHDMGVVADLADRVMVMKDGVVVESGDIQDIYYNPQHPYTKQLLAAVPHLGQAGPEAITITEHRGETIVEVPSSRSHAVLAFDSVSIEYPKRGRIPAFRAAEDISLHVAPGEILALVGESGSGKTTLGRAAVGLLPIASGMLLSCGVSIDPKTKRSDLQPLRKKAGIVFQDPASSLNPRFPIGESISEPLWVSGERSKTILNARVEQLLDQVELPRSYRNRFPHELSGGQKQRVGIARALALTPDLLIADEPTSALDVSVQARFLELLQHLQEQLQFACLFITHDLAVVDALAHRIAVMHQGKLVEQGNNDQILRHPREAYTKRLISAVPVPDPAEQRVRREARQMMKAHSKE